MISTNYKYQLLPVIMSILIIILSNSIVIAKDLYVSTSGDDSISYSNNDINHPWSTPKHAWYTAQPGDTVYFRGGIYYITTMIDTKYSGMSGSAANPIKFTNYNIEDVTFSSTLSTVFRIEKDYNYISNINCIGPKTFFFVSYDLEATNFVIENCTYNMTIGGDNVGFVRFGTGGNEGAKNSLIKNCTITGPGLRSEGIHGNTAGIIAFCAIGLKILNCEISNCPIGIYYKHRNAHVDSGIEIAYNYIHDTDRFSMELNCNYANVHDNLMGPNNARIQVNEANGAPGGDYNIINHNTFYNCHLELSYDTDSMDPLPGAIQNTVTNNIFIERTDFHPYSSIAHNTIINYNLYNLASAVNENRIIYNLTNWEAHYGQDSNSIEGSPLFAGGGSPSSIADYLLASGSMGKSAASDGKDMGADISQVGVQAGSAPKPTPEAPNTPMVDCVEIFQEDFGPHVIFHDEFEDSIPMSEKYADYNSHNDDCAVTDSMAFGGSSKSVRARWQAGQVDAGGFAYMFGRNPSASQSYSLTDFREIYWKFYIKTSKEWTGNPGKLSRATIFATSNWAQAMIAHLWGEGDDLVLTMDPATGIDSDGNLVTTTYNDFENLRWLGIKKGATQIYDTSMSNTWHCIEAHVKLNTPGSSDGVFEFWIDGNLEAIRDDLNWVGSWQDYGINVIMFGNYWNGGAPRAQERFIDNIVISTERIGLSPSPVNPIIFKTAFEDPDAGDTQSAFQSQVSTTPDTTGLVWTGEISGSANIIKVDIQNGFFQGTLSEKTSLDAGKYYVRVRHADNSGNYSSWSPWKPFRASGIDPLGKPNSPKNLHVVQ